MAVPSFRSQIFAIADALLGGTPISVSSGGGGSTSDLPWDGRKPDEEEEAYRRRCLLFAVGVVKRQNGIRIYRRQDKENLNLIILFCWQNKLLFLFLQNITAYEFYRNILNFKAYEKTTYISGKTIC